MARFRRSFNTRGRVSSQNDAGDDDEFAVKVDRNAFYRTLDIVNRIFKKKLRLVAGKQNMTDLETIWVNFGEKRMRAIVGEIGPGKSVARTVYQLECGHEEQLKSGHPTDGSALGACSLCGAAQAYLGFEHELQHPIFKTSIAMKKVFVEKYVDSLMVGNNHPNRDELTTFVHMMVNGFDDLRCNSLWEKVYLGSANNIWERWERLTREKGDLVNTSFLAFLFAVAFGVETDPKSEFEKLRPIVAWGVQKVKYRGFGKMLLDVRIVLDRCMGTLLDKFQQPPQLGQPQPQGQLPQPGDDDDGEEDTDREGHEDEEEGVEGSPGGGQAGQGALASDGQAPGGEVDSDADGSGGNGASARGGGSGAGSAVPQSAGKGAIRQEEPIAPPIHAPSAQASGASPLEKLEAFLILAAGAEELDDKERHPEVDPKYGIAKMSQADQAALAQALGLPIDDLQEIDAGIPNEPDFDMQQAIQQLQDSNVEVSKDSQLTSNAKAKIRLVTVHPEGVAASRVELNEMERATVNRLRSAFIRSLGSQKNKRMTEGNIVDIQALIRHRFDHQDPEIFEADEANKGFAYAILCDMSGSMYSCYPYVTRAAEMLKKSLDFPFVDGELWGFRGGEGRGGDSEPGEVWIYRYDEKCQGYTGTTRHRVWQDAQGRFSDTSFPVQCGGMTPMHSAVHVVSTRLRTQVPASMAKRLFLLTDGSPAHTKTTGAQLPGWMLQSFVAKEIKLARQHGVQVYTVVIGQDSISDAECKKMFGERRYWQKTGTADVGDALSKLVLANFSKYLSSRG